MSRRVKVALLVLAAAVGWSLAAIVSGEADSLWREVVGAALFGLFGLFAMLCWTAKYKTWSVLLNWRRRDRR